MEDRVVTVHVDVQFTAPMKYVLRTKTVDMTPRRPRRSWRSCLRTVLRIGSLLMRMRAMITEALVITMVTTIDTRLGVKDE